MYERREQMTTWIAAGAGAMIAFLAAGALKDRPQLFTQLVFFVAIISGYTIALARVGFEWSATLIKRDIEDKKVDIDDRLADSMRDWPSSPEHYWMGAIWSLFLGWVIMAVGIWWPQIMWIHFFLTRLFLTRH
jgi:hypothetical protein